MKQNKTAHQVKNQINRAYRNNLKAEGSNGLRRVNAQVADYLRDADLVAPEGQVAYPAWSAKPPI